MVADQRRVIAFLCAHGALKSRLAAAYFNVDAPAGWQAISAGVHPQESVSVHAAPLLAGTPAAAFLDTDPPRALAAGEVARVVAIDCQIPGASQWWLTNDDPGLAMRDELRTRVHDLIAHLDQEAHL